MAILYRYTRNVNLSQDLLQETFISIFKYLENFDSKKGSFDNWTARIAVNKFLQLKRKKNEITYPEVIPEISKAGEDELISKLTVQELKAVIEQLPEIHRVILNLVYFEEYSHAEIAEILGIKPSSSRAQLSRAKVSLVSIWSKINTSYAL